MGKDYYAILGVQKTAGEDEIKKAYRSLAKKFHPDVNPGNKEAEEKFKDINEAYAVLGDKIKRSQYDSMGHSGFKSKYDFSDIFSGFKPDEDIFGNFFKGSSGGRGMRFSFGGNDMGSFFETFFGDRAQGARPQREGRDYEYGLTIDFMTAVKGGQREISFETDSGLERVMVKIPKGIEDGQRIRLKGKGGAGYGGSLNGDIYLNVSVSPHPFFRREGNDIFVEVPLTVWEAVLGARISVPTVEGSANVAVPRGTASGQKLRLKGKGVETSKGARGDQYVTIKIVPPKSLDSESLKALERIAQKNSYNPREGLS